MIKIADYYKKNTSTIANLNKFANVEKNSDVFPFEGVYIGEFESVTGHQLPALLSFEEVNGLCFLSNSSNRELINRSLQAIVLRLIASLPTGLCKFILYDGTGLGANLITLSNLNSKITGGEIITSPHELLSLLKNIQGHIPNVIQKVLGYKHSGETLIEYNLNAKNNAVPYNFIVITDYPQTFTKEHYESLKMILRNCKRAGVFVIMSMDTTYNNADKYDETPYIDILNHLTTIYEKDGRYCLKNTLHDELFRKFKLTLDSDFLNDVDDVLEYIKSKEENVKKHTSLDLIDYMPKAKFWWNKTSEKELKIPFGMTPESELVNLSITQTSGQNVAVVVGIPGSGKSVFLNTIITSSAIHYSPDEIELYLIDFSGVEFNIYADMALPHARVIAPESEREFGISVLRRIKDEGNRRIELFRQAGVNNITDYRRNNPSEKMPRILVIIDEFQTFFENDMDEISGEAENIIHIIVQKYRKFGINLILATQGIHKYVNKIEMGMIANRVAFEWKEDDSYYLFAGQAPSHMVSEPGDCVYNNKSGKALNNIQTKSFNVSPAQLRPVLEQLSTHAKSQKCEDKNTIVFRSNALAYMNINKNLNLIEKNDLPNTVKVYIGEPIAISEDHVYIELQHSTNANILIVGGQGYNAALRIAINCVKSLVLAHNDNKAHFAFLNFMQNDSEMNLIPKQLYGNIPFPHDFVEADNQLEYLENIKNEIGRRQTNPLIKKRHMYISIYAYQYAYSYRQEGGEWGDMSEYGKLISYILEQGPLVGIFTILQVDELGSLKKSIISPLSLFNHRVVLQMSENDSREMVDTPIASKIYVEDKQSSKNRAYYYNKNNNTIIKFKPYEI